MLDLKLLRTDPDRVRDGVAKKGIQVDIDGILELDGRRRELLPVVEGLKATRNAVSEEIARLRSEGKEATDRIEEMRRVSRQIKEMEEELREMDAELRELLLTVPNLPHESVPVGRDETENVEVRRWGQPREFAFTPKAHWELGTTLGILDFERAAKITGARFVVYRGLGAKLVRALVNFMLDLHCAQHGYLEVFPPFLVNRESAVGTGQLPRFEEDLFQCRDTDYYLVPTAEVPLTNLHRDEVLDGSVLPLYYTAYTACFRAEAGAAGRDTRGLIRQHQFDKVELVKFVKPEDSYAELEKLAREAGRVLEVLGLPYRVVAMCTGDLGFTATKKYDLDVWMPSYGRYVEVSSCSNCTDFQARRGNIRYRPAVGARPEFAHTLNGSGVAVGRCLAAILENCQEEDGSVSIPEALRPYMSGIASIGR